MTTPLYIRHDHLLYTVRYRDNLITSITKSYENNREPQSLSWDELDVDLQEEILNSIPRNEN